MSGITLALTIALAAVVGWLLGVGFMLSKEGDRKTQAVFDPRVPRLKQEAWITISDQLAKVNEEVTEAYKAYADYKMMRCPAHVRNLVEECSDVLHAAHVLHRKVCEETGVHPFTAWDVVVQKNLRRGLYL